LNKFTSLIFNVISFNFEDGDEEVINALKELHRRMFEDDTYAPLLKELYENSMPVRKKPYTKEV
jgi:hypothetical protein